MKISIKREQSQAGLSFAERENRRSAAGGKAKFRPQVKNKLLLLLALLLTAATGAWATTPNSIVINGTPLIGDKSISLTYHFDPNNVPNLQGYAPTLKVKCAADNKWDETLLSLTEVSSGTTNISLENLGEFEAGKTYQVCFAYNNGSWVDEVFQSFVPTADAPAGYTVTMKDGVKDADKWTVKVGEGQAQALPIGGLTGDGKETVTLQYNGRLKVKGVTATSDAAAEVTYTLLSAATTSDYGKVVCAAGHLHDAKTAVPDGCTAVGILGKVTETGHGLILALKDATSQNWNTINGWESVTTYAGTTLKVLPDDAARGTNLTSYTTLGGTAVSNWAVGGDPDYEAIFKNLGGAIDDWGMYVLDNNVNAYITTGVGGSALDGEYWTAWSAEELLEELLEGDAVMFYINTWSADRRKLSKKVRPVLGFGGEAGAPAAKPAATVTAAPTGAAVVGVGKSTALVSGGVADGGTLWYAVTTTNTKPASTDGFSGTVPTAQTITASGTVYVWYYVKGDDTHSDSEIAATPIEVPVAIIWDATNVKELDVFGNHEPCTIDGVTLSGNAEEVYARWSGYGNPEKDGISFETMESGGFTFKAPNSKKFTKIEMTLTGPAGWDYASLGTGWLYSDDPMTEIFKVTWKGSAASTVDLLKDAGNFNGERVKSIVFYLSDAE